MAGVDDTPDVPVLVPFNGQDATSFRPTLQWADAAGAASYTLDYATRADFANSTTIAGLSASEYEFPTPLTEDTYFWRVKSVAADGTESAYSAADSYVVIPTLQEWVTIGLALTRLLYGIRRHSATTSR